MQEVFRDKLYIAQNIQTESLDIKYRVFKTSDQIMYFPFCDDFGPMSMCSIIQFAGELDSEISIARGQKIVFLVDSGRRSLTNAGNWVCSSVNLTKVLPNILM